MDGMCEKVIYLKVEQAFRLMCMTDEVAKLINGLSKALPQ